VSSDQPQAESDVERHEGDKGHAQAKRDFAAALVRLRFRRQYNLLRIAARSSVNPARDGQFALQLFIENQLFFESGAFLRRQSPFEIIEKFVGVHRGLEESVIPEKATRNAQPRNDGPALPFGRCRAVPFPGNLVGILQLAPRSFAEPGDGPSTFMKHRLSFLAGVACAVALLSAAVFYARGASDRALLQLNRQPSLEPGNSSGGELTLGQENASAASATPRKKPDILYVPTPQQLVDVMLDMAKVTRDDIVYDLGCGDGRLVITAAKKFGATGVGIDIDPQRISESRQNARRAGVEGKVRFLEQDLFESDFHDATVVTLYLLSELNLRLRPHIFAQLKPGTRVVSHAFKMGDWEPDAHKTIEINGNSYDAYCWVVPANMSGIWNVTGDGRLEVPAAIVVEQKFQKIALHAEGDKRLLGEGTVSGTSFTFTLNSQGDGDPRQFYGRIRGDTIEAAEAGRPQRHWKAARAPGSARPLDPAGGG